MKTLASFMVSVALVCSVQGQSTVDMFETLRLRIDSLVDARTTLEGQVAALDEEISALERELRQKQVERMSEAEVVISTNMEASLRAFPAPNARVLRSLPRGALLGAIDYDGAYWKVIHDGMEGWVMRVFVDEGEDAAAFKQQLAMRGRRDKLSGDIRPAALEEDRDGKALLVTEFGIHPPNSAGGIALHYTFEHLDSTRTIREISFTFTPFDSDGEVQTGRNTGISTKRIRRFGPITILDGPRSYELDNFWYNANISCIELNRLDVAYTNGTRASYAHNVHEILSQRLLNDCKVTTAATTIE